MLLKVFTKGIGRTVRACCYFVLCVKAGGLLKGKTLLPQLLSENRDQHVAALKHADKMNMEQKTIEEVLAPLTELIRNLVSRQLQS